MDRYATRTEHSKLRHNCGSLSLHLAVLASIPGHFFYTPGIDGWVYWVFISRRFLPAGAINNESTGRTTLQIGLKLNLKARGAGDSYHKYVIVHSFGSVIKISSATRLPSSISVTAGAEERTVQACTHGSKVI